MPAELMLVNPRARKRRKSRRVSVSGRRNPRPRKKRRMTALQRKFFGPRRKKYSYRKVRHTSAEGVVTTRRKRVKHRSSRRGLGSFLKSKSGGVSLNPRSVLKGEVMPAIIGAMGAVAADVIWAAIPSQILPASIKSGPLSPLAKAAVVIGAGYLGGRFVNRKVGEAIAAGGLLVIGYDVVKGLIKSAVPSLPLAEYISSDVGYISPAQFLPSPDIAQHLGQYISGSPSPTNAWSAGDQDVLDHVS